MRLVHLAMCLAAAISITGCSYLTDSGQAAGQAQQPTAITANSVTTQRVILVDAKGKERGSFAVIDDRAEVRLEDPSGSPRAVMVVTAAGVPAVNLFDQRGIPRATVQVGANGDSGVALYDKTGQHRAAMLVSAEGEPQVVFFDASGNPMAAAPGDSTAGRKPRGGGE